MDVGGVGYGVLVTGATAGNLPAVGESVRLWTWLIVREDDLTLYGFHDVKEREAFGRLIGASGVGPRLALAILSCLKVGELARAVSRGDCDVLTRAPGVGRKKAEKLCVDLKGKFDDLAAVVAADAAAGDDGFRPSGDAQEEAILALVALGARQDEARRRVGEAVSEHGADADVETLVGAAMRSRR